MRSTKNGILPTNVEHNHNSCPPHEAPKITLPEAFKYVVQGHPCCTPCIAGQTGVKSGYAQTQEKLRELQCYLKEWDQTHQPDMELVAQALALTAKAHQEKSGLSIRNKTYSKAQRIMRHGQGIDDKTYARAKKTFGQQGAVDAAAPMLGTLIFGPLNAVFGGMKGALFKYCKFESAAPAAGGAAQIAVNAYGSLATTNQGRPDYAQNIKSAPTFWKLRREVTRKDGVLRQAQGLRKEARAVLQGDSKDSSAVLEKLRKNSQALTRTHNQYVSRVALGTGNATQFATQGIWRAATMPAVYAAGTTAGPAGYWGANLAQRLLCAPFGYIDEILYKSHIIRANMKYADVLTDKAIQEGISRETAEAHHYCPQKLGQLWKKPIDVIRESIRQVYADELALKLRKLTKREAAAQCKPGEKPDPIAKAKAERARNAVHMLKRDIAVFETGDWGMLCQNGTIARMLSSKKSYFWHMLKVGFRTPGNYMAQAINPHGGATLAMTASGVLADGVGLSYQDSSTSAAAGRGGVIMYTSPVGLFTKQQDLLPDMTPERVDPHAEPIMRKNLFGKSRPVTEGHLKPQVKISLCSDESLHIDLQGTRSWYNHTRSSGYIVAETFVDFVKSMGKQLAAPVTLPVRLAVGTYTDRSIKREIRKNAALQRKLEQPIKQEKPAGSDKGRFSTFERLMKTDKTRTAPKPPFTFSEQKPKEI